MKIETIREAMANCDEKYFVAWIKGYINAYDEYNSKEDNDGWIEWRGGECPVDGETPVWVKYRNEQVDTKSKAHSYRWFHDGDAFDIIAYRIVK